MGIQVLQVFATDADIGYNAEIAYTISNNTGDPNGKLLVPHYNIDI